MYICIYVILESVTANVWTDQMKGNTRVRIFSLCVHRVQSNVSYMSAWDHENVFHSPF